MGLNCPVYCFPNFTLVVGPYYPVFINIGGARPSGVGMGQCLLFVDVATDQREGPSPGGGTLSLVGVGYIL